MDTTPKMGGDGTIAPANWDTWELGPYKTFPPRRQLISEYWLMRQYEPTCKRVLALLRSLIISHCGQYEHDDPAITQRVRTWLLSVDGGIANVMASLLSSMWAGFAIAEPIWDTTTGEWLVRRCNLLHPLTFFDRNAAGENAEGIKIDTKEGRVTEMRQFSGQAGGTNVTHKADDMLYWALHQELREQVYGVSLLAAARRAWYSKTKIEQFWNTFCEKSAMPTPVFSCPIGTVKDPNTNEDILWTKYLTDFWSKLQPGMAVAIPTDGENQFNVELLIPGSDGMAFERLTSYWKNELFNSMITPRLALEEPEHASRGQTESVMDLYYLVIDGIREELGRVIVDQLLKKMLIANVGELEDYGTWHWEPLQHSDLELLARVFETVQRGMAQATMSGLPFNPADEQKLRDTFSQVLATPQELGEMNDPITPTANNMKRYGTAGRYA